MPSIWNSFTYTLEFNAIISLVVASVFCKIWFGHSRGNDLKSVPKLYQPERILGLALFKELAKSAKAGTYLKDSRARFEENGYTYSLVLAGSTIIQTAEPENIQAVLGHLQSDYDSGTVRLNSAYPLLGKGIFTSDGEYWAHSRAMLKPCFAIRGFNLGNVETHVSRLFSIIPPDGQAVDLQPLFFKLSMDTSTVFLLGESTNSLISNQQIGSESEQFSRAFDYCSTEIMTRVRMGKFMFLHRNQKFSEACKICHRFADKYVKKALERYQKVRSENTGLVAPTLLDELMTQTQDPLELRCQLLHLLLAGRDTTASLLSSLIFVLSNGQTYGSK